MIFAFAKREMSLLFLLATAACGDDPPGLIRAELGISANKEGSAVGDVGCEALPVLRGSRSLSRYVVDDRFDVVVDANADRAEVRFQENGVDVHPPVVVPRGALEAGGYETVVELEVGGIVLGLGDDNYTVRLVSGCGS